MPERWRDAKYIQSGRQSIGGKFENEIKRNLSTWREIEREAAAMTETEARAE